MNDKILYEYPLNENIRFFLRLEYLHNQIKYFIKKAHGYETRVVISALLDIYSLLEHYEIKNDLLKVLDQQYHKYSGMLDKAGVDRDKLAGLLGELLKAKTDLSQQDFELLNVVSEGHFLHALRKRNRIPASACSFDLPAYHQWMHQSMEAINTDLNCWFDSLSALSYGVCLALSLIRQSAVFELVRLDNLSYQKSISGDKSQLLRLKVDHHLPYFPEVSAGKHRYSINFIGKERLSSDQGLAFSVAMCE